MFPKTLGAKRDTTLYVPIVLCLEPSHEKTRPIAAS